MPIRYRVVPGGRRVVERPAETYSGTVAEIMDRVGRDAASARAALAAEQERDKPRATLVRKLEDIAGE